MSTRLDQIGLIVTCRCNLNCKYCFYNNEDYPSNQNNLDYMKIVSFLERIAKVTQIRKLFITGGEPLSMGYIMNLIAYAERKFEEVSLYTNGTLISEDILKRLIDNVVQLEISLDSLKEENTNQYRGHNLKVMNVLQIINEHGYSSHITINVIVSPENLDDVEDIIKYTKEKNFKMNLNLMDSSGSLSWNQASTTQIDKVLSVIREFYAFENNNYHYKLAEFTLKRQERTVPRCYFSKRSLIVDSDEIVYPCFHNKSPLGNINDDVTFILENHQKFLFSHCSNFSCYRTACYSLF